jgi:ABC-type transporter Mla subunit MlaD
MHSVILSQSQSKALSDIEKRLDYAVKSLRNQSETIISQLGDVHIAVQDLPRLASTVDDISAKVVRTMTTMDDMSVKLDLVVRSKS